MRRHGQIAIFWVLILLAGFTHGCAGGLAWLAKDSQDPATLPAETYRAKADALEQQGEWRQAVFTWRVVAHLDPEDPGVTDTIAALERRIAETANARYQEGVVHFQKEAYEAARNAFLSVLLLDPDHQGARHHLNTRLYTTGHATYRVQRGDSFTKIANDVYKDVSKAYVLAYFNDMDPHRPLLIGTVLVLPQLDARQLLPRRDLLALLDQAQQALQENRFGEVIRLTERIKTQSPGNVQARQLADAAHFALATALIEQKDYPAALTRLQHISPNHRGRDQAMAQAQRHLQRQASDEKLRLAQQHLDNGELQAAITLSRQILERQPAHREARGISDAAHYALGREHLEQGRENQAIAALSALDKNYQDTAQLLSQAHARRNTRAETHYREGVMHFLGEELERAIESWEKCLALNPNHPKARQDIDNAKRLLEKWQTLDKRP